MEDGELPLYRNTDTHRSCYYFLWMQSSRWDFRAVYGHRSHLRTYDRYHGKGFGKVSLIHIHQNLCPFILTIIVTEHTLGRVCSQYVNPIFPA